jgi:SsrA-binding protein
LAKKQKQDDGAVCRNRKALFRFHILEQLECGIALRGTEVKSLREQSASLAEAFARIEKGEVWLVKFHIPAYSHGHTAAHDPTRPRKLLLHAREVRKLIPKIEQKGQTLVPLRVYFNARGLAKVTLALAKGKTFSDKRETMKTRDDKRDMDRAAQRRR